MTDELRTIIDLIRYGASRFNAAGLIFGHSYDNALDEATQLTLHALHLPHDLSPVYGQARVTLAEKEDVLALFLRRIEERVPAAYLTGEAWFAGLSFKSDPRALVPRSPIAELILEGFEPWLGGRDVRRALDLCTGSGCIAIAMAHYNPDWHVDGADLSTDALDLANENAARLGVENVRFLQSDLFNSNQRPAVDVGISVSRVGGDAQIKAMKKVSGTLKITLAQYRSQAAFAMFASDLDATTRRQLTRGERLMELLKQPQYTPYPVEEQVVSVWAGTNGYLDTIEVSDVAKFERGYIDYLKHNTDILNTIVETGNLDGDTEESLKEATEKFLDSFTSAYETQDLPTDEVEPAEQTQETLVRAKRS